MHSWIAASIDGGDVRRSGLLHANDFPAVLLLIGQFQRIVTDAVSRFGGEVNGYQGDGASGARSISGRVDPVNVWIQAGADDVAKEALRTAASA